MTKSEIEFSADMILDSVADLSGQNAANFSVYNVETIYYEGAIVGFVINLDPEGFLLVSSADELTPVQLVQFSGTYPDSLPPVFLENIIKENAATMTKLGYYSSLPGIESILSELNGKIKNKVLEERNITLWNLFLNGQNPYFSYLKNQEPNNTTRKSLFTASWHQSLPYNLYTPIYYGNDPEGERTVAGCTAIAQSILMKYWEWPEYGIGSKSIIFNNGIENETYEADFSTRYRWDLMESAYNSPYNSDATMPDEEDIPESVKQTAKVVFHNGVLVYMDYGVSGSGASFNIKGMVDHFKYSDDFSAFRTGFPSEKIKVIKEQIDNDLPVLADWAGKNDSAGHSFLIIGYDIRDIYLSEINNPDSDYNRKSIFALNLGHGSNQVWKSFEYLYENNFAGIYIDIYPEGYCGDRDLPYDCDDQDGVPFYKDNCPKHFNPLQEDPDHDGIGLVCQNPEGDYDGDGVKNKNDNCPIVANQGQEDWDNNGVGDACDDFDNDGVVDKDDNCRETYNPLEFFDSAQEFFSMVSTATDYLCSNNGVLNICNSSKRNGLIQAHPEMYKTSGWTHMPPSWQPDHDMDGIGDACDNGEAYNGIFVSVEKTISESENPDSSIILFGKKYKNSYVQLSTWLTRPNATPGSDEVQVSNATFQNFYCAVDQPNLQYWGDAGYCTVTDGENVNRPPAQGGRNFGYSHGTDPYPINPVRNKQAWNETTQSRFLYQITKDNELFCPRESWECNLGLRNPDVAYEGDEGKGMKFLWNWKVDICSDFYTREDLCIPFINPPQGETAAMPFHYTISTGLLAKSRKYLSNLCGNGIVDQGEQCDDGNLLRRDGCDDSCSFEYITKYFVAGETKKFVDPRFFRHEQVYNRSWRMNKNSRRLSYYYTERSLPDISDEIDLPERFDKYLCYKCLIDRIRPGIIDIWRYGDDYASKDRISEPDGRISQVFSTDNSVVWAIEDTGSESILKRYLINASGEWETVSSLLNYPAGLEGSSVIMLEDSFILVGGKNNDAFSPYLYYASQSAESHGFFEIETIAQLPAGVSTAFPMIVNENLYVVGNNGATVSVFALINDDNGNLPFKFEEIALQNKPVARLTATYENDGSKIFVIGGVDINGNAVNKIEAINLEKSTGWVGMDVENVESMKRGVVLFNGNEITYTDIESANVESTRIHFDIEKMNYKTEIITSIKNGFEAHCLDSISEGTTVTVSDGFLQEEYCNSSLQNYGLIDLPENIRTIEGENNIIYAGSESGIAVINIENIDSPIVMERHSLYGPVKDILIVNGYVYAASGNGIDVFKIENDGKLIKKYHRSTYGDTARLIYFNGRIYAGDGQGIKVISIQNPETPTVIKSVSTSGDISDMALGSSKNLYIYDWGGIKVYNLENRDNPVKTASKYYSCSNAAMMSYSGGSLMKCGNSLKYLVKNGTSVTIQNISGSPSVKDVFVREGKLFKISNGNIEIMQATGELSAPVCGNGIIESGELCDGNSVACTTISSSYISGSAYCNSTCNGYNEENCETDGW
ncbi:MAG TPA: C10 family peptidase [bacterium]|nr:C10 family peptidase [bacterium]